MTLMSVIILVLNTLVGLMFFGLFCWAVRDGQLADVEEAKYQMFREDEGDAE